MNNAHCFPLYLSFVLVVILTVLMTSLAYLLIKSTKPDQVCQNQTWRFADLLQVVQTTCIKLVKK